MTSQEEEDIVIPEQMSVGELRSWLSRFGDKNREHYEQNKITKRVVNADFQKRIQQMEQSLCSTSSDSSSRDSIGDTRNSYQPVRKMKDRRFNSKTFDRGVDKGEGSLHPDAIPEEPSLSEDSFFAKLLDREEETAATQPSFEDLHSSPERHLGLEDESTIKDEDYKIESIHKILETPKPVHHHKPAGSWDAFFDDDFFDPAVSTKTQTSFIDQQEEVTSFSSLMANRDDTEDAEMVASDDESTASSLFDNLRQDHHEPTYYRGDDSISTKSRSSTLSKSSRGSIRSRLPMLLCKSVKDERPKLVQRTFSNSWPEVDSLYVREHSPFPRNLSTGHTKEKSDAVIVEPEPMFDSLTDVFAPHNQRNTGDSNSTVSCPDFAAATAFLQQYSKNHDGAGHSHRRGRDRKDTRAASKQSEAMYGTSAILPGAIDFSMGRAFQLDEPSSSAVQEENDYKPHRRGNIGNCNNVKNNVTKFGGAGSRRKSAVQQRQEDLKKHWTATRSVQHTKTVKWQVCAKTGNYKKKIVVGIKDDEEGK